MKARPAVDLRRAPAKPATEADLRAAAKFLRGDPNGADIKVLARVATFIESQAKKRAELKRKAKEDRQNGIGK